MSTGTVWDNLSCSQQFEAKVMDLQLPNKAQAQISELPNGQGFLLRVWGPNELAKDGGGNMTTLTAIIDFKDDRSELQKVDYWPWAKPKGGIS